MSRRLTLRREALTELSPADLTAVVGANTGVSCVPNEATRNDVCDALTRKVRDLTTAIAVTMACPETR